MAKTLDKIVEKLRKDNQTEVLGDDEFWEKLRKLKNTQRRAVAMVETITRDLRATRIGANAINSELRDPSSSHIVITDAQDSTAVLTVRCNGDRDSKPLEVSIPQSYKTALLKEYQDIERSNQNNGTKQKSEVQGKNPTETSSDTSRYEGGNQART